MGKAIASMVLTGTGYNTYELIPMVIRYYM